MIKKLGNGKFQLWTEDGSRPLGPVTSEIKAKRQEIAIKIAEKSRKSGGTNGR